MLIQIFINSLCVGAIYGLVAIGFVMLLKSIDLVNFAHGDVVMAGAFLGLFFYRYIGLPYFLSFFLTIVSTGLIGVLIERFIIRQLKKPTLMFMVTGCIAVSMIMRNSALLMAGADPIRVPSFFGDMPIIIGPFRIIPVYIAILVIVGILMIFLQLFFKFNKYGIAMRAVMTNREGCSLVGVKVDRVVSLTFAISAALGGAGGFLIGPITHAVFDMGVIGLKAFTAAVLGGMLSITGAVVGGLLLGLIETLTALYISSAYKDTITFAILIFVLLYRPYGLIGTRQ
jgi:branched-chain amino acid transport system permease protein